MTDFNIIIAVAAVLLFSSFALLTCRTKGRKRLQSLLIQSKKELQDVIRISMKNPYPLLQVDRGELVFANTQAFDVFEGLSQKNTNHSVLKNIQKRIDEELSGFSDEVSYNGVCYYRTVVLSDNEDKSSYIVYFYDISNRKKYENDIKLAYENAEKARVLAEEAKQARGVFLANMSHELRTPMNGIIGLSDLIRDNASDKKNKELAEAVYTSSKNLLVVLNDILDFSKIEAGEMALESVPFSVQDMLEKLEKLYKPIISDKGLNFKINIGDNVPEFVSGDPTRINQILTNLVSNAIKFTYKGYISVDVNCNEKCSDGVQIYFLVKDTGIGISQEQITKIFSKFQQAESSTTRKYGGTGLGLSITKQLIEIMDGDLQVESKPGKGSSFNVLLPLQPAPANYKSLRQREEKRYQMLNTQVRVLLVDDHPINLLYLEQALSSFGLKDLSTASSGLEAIRLCQSQSFDLIFMDCHMPEMDGYVAAQKIRGIKGFETTPIVAITADAMKGVRAECIYAGMDDFVTKPVEKSRIYDVLTKWITPTSDAINTANIKKPLPRKSDTTFDWNKLGEFSKGDKDFEDKIIKLFLETLGEDLVALRESHQAEDFELWLKVVHKIYGASVNIGAKTMAAICDQSHKIEIGQIEEIWKLQSDIDKEYQQIRRLLSPNYRFLNSIAS